MIGLLKPLRGAVVIDGTDIVVADGEERVNLLRKIGVAYQNGALFGSMSVLTNVALPLEEFTDLPRPAIEMIAQMKLKAVGLQAAAYKMPSELSGGMANVPPLPGPWPCTRRFCFSMSRRPVWTRLLRPRSTS